MKKYSPKGKYFHHKLCKVNLTGRYGLSQIDVSLVQKMFLDYSSLILLCSDDPWYCHFIIVLCCENLPIYTFKQIHYIYVAVVADFFNKMNYNTRVEIFFQ